MEGLGQPRHLGHRRDDGVAFFLSGVFVTLLVHVTVVVAVVIGTITGSQAIEKQAEVNMAPFIPVKLIKLGVERPKNHLPRISNPAPRTVEEKVVNLANKAKTPDEVVLKKEEPKDAKKVKRKEKINSLLDSIHNPNRPVNDDKPEGLSSGVAEGTVVDDAQKALMNTWMAKMQRAIIRQWRVPQTITRTRAKELAGQVRIYVRVSDEGYVVSWRFKRKSEDSQFNGACEDAVRKFSVKSGGGRKLPMPDQEDVRKLIVKRGFTLTRWKGAF
jgi:hypothetical protein